MIDTIIEIRSVDKKWLILALHHTIAKLQSTDDTKGCSGQHNFDLFYQIKPIEVTA
jgi:hypothetical protein